MLLLSLGSSDYFSRDAKTLHNIAQVPTQKKTIIVS